MPTLTHTRMIGFSAMAVCVLGYGGMAIALTLGKTEVLTPTHSVLAAAVSALIGEIGLWVGAACLGLTLFKKRKAMLDRLLRRKSAPVTTSGIGA